MRSKQVNNPQLLKAHAHDANMSFFIRNIEKLSGPKRSMKITDHFTCTSASVIYCITCETGRRLGDRFQEHLRDVEKDDKNASKPVARHFNLPNHSKQHMAVCGFSLHQGSSESRNKNLFFKSALLIFTVSTNAFHSTNVFCCFRSESLNVLSVLQQDVGDRQIFRPSLYLSR